jgi:hypothetical protein
MGETDRSQILDLFDLWSSSCEIMKFFHLEVIQIPNPILHTAWLDNHALTLKNIIFMKNPDFFIPS